MTIRDSRSEQAPTQHTDTETYPHSGDVQHRGEDLGDRGFGIEVPVEPSEIPLRDVPAHDLIVNTDVGAFTARDVKAYGDKVLQEERARLLRESNDKKDGRKKLLLKSGLGAVAAVGIVATVVAMNSSSDEKPTSTSTGPVGGDVATQSIDAQAGSGDITSTGAVSISPSGELQTTTPVAEIPSAQETQTIPSQAVETVPVYSEAEYRAMSFEDFRNLSIEQRLIGLSYIGGNNAGASEEDTGLDIADNIFSVIENATHVEDARVSDSYIAGIYMDTETSATSENANQFNTMLDYIHKLGIGQDRTSLSIQVIETSEIKTISYDGVDYRGREIVIIDGSDGSQHAITAVMVEYTDQYGSTAGWVMVDNRTL